MHNVRVRQQWFSGNPLNRSAGDRKSAKFVDDALHKSSSLFLPIATSDDGRAMFMLARDESMPEHRSERTAKSAMKRVGRHGDFAIGTKSMHLALRRLVFLSASEAEAVIGKPPSLSNAVLLGGLPLPATAGTANADAEASGYVWHWALQISHTLDAAAPAATAAAAEQPASTARNVRECLSSATGGCWVTGRELLQRLPLTDAHSTPYGYRCVRFPMPDVAVGGQALALCRWHAQNRFSAATGSPTKPAEGGSRRCACVRSPVPPSSLNPGAAPRRLTSCANRDRAYPRTDLAAIFLTISPCGRFVLLGKSARFARLGRQGFFSCLAGFVEQAEAVEETVRREAMEEAGLLVGEVRLFASQPWPIGRAGACELMIGAFARAKPRVACAGTQTGVAGSARVDKAGNLPELPPVAPLDGELVEVRWFSRDDVRLMIGRADRGVVDGSGSGQEVVPGDYAIAYHLLKAWAIDGFTFETGREHKHAHIAPASHMLVKWAAAGAAFAATAFILLKWSRNQRHT